MKAAVLVVAVCALLVAPLRAQADQCDGDLVWNECGTPCPLDCADASSAEAMCAAVCVEGCFCPRGMWLHKDTSSCHASFQECPATFADES